MLCLEDIREKYKTGDYICVVENRFGGKGYFIKDTGFFKENWKYTLVHKKDKEVLDAYLLNNNIDIYTNAWADNYQDYYKLSDIFILADFVELYNENYSWKLK